jgi:hypothetical protein
MDEHMKLLEGKAIFLKNDFIDENIKTLDWWINKHNSYATREAADMLLFNCTLSGQDKNIGPPGSQVQIKRWLKTSVYLRLPLFLRAFLYFIYRYFLRLGFLDGREGLIWHFLQGFWYRFLVDAKIYEIKKKAKAENKTTVNALEELYSLKVTNENG